MGKLKFVELNKEEYKELCRQDRETKKDGGFQGFMVGLQEKTNTATQTVKLTEKDLEKIPEMAFDSGKGGWEDRLVKIFGRTLGPKLGRD